jgi:hypothetical protein
MNTINDDNIDDIMFRLLEGDITGKEREQLLDAIEADPAYSALWKTWQQTILLPENDVQTMDIRTLKKKSAYTIPLFYRYAAAAMVILGLTFALYYKQENTDITVAVGPLKPIQKMSGSKVPRLENDTVSYLKYGKDTFVPFREKIRHTASVSADKATWIPEKTIRNEQNPELPEQLELPVELPLVQKPDAIVSEIPVKAGDKANIADEVFVSVSTETPGIAKAEPKKGIRALLSSLTGGPQIRIENDSNTRTNKKIIIQNNKYQIIAGF